MSDDELKEMLRSSEESIGRWHRIGQYVEMVLERYEVTGGERNADVVQARAMVKAELAR